MLQVYNSLTRTKEPFEPLEPGKVRMYACGITVYDYLHIGHARMLLVYDLVSRYLRARGYETTYVRNITDIDDNIIRRANERGVSSKELAEQFIVAMHEDCLELGMKPPDHEPRATDHIEDIITMVQALEAKGYAYQGSNGDVFYRVNKFEDYGCLSGRRIEDLRAGERIAVEEAKEDPLDFVLWKMSKPGEPTWPSPWGEGRPGWHIECSAMSTALLGNSFDVHGGGMDLKFPHHENEIAQSCAATGEPFVKYWIHNGFVEVNSEKMSKSLDNFFTVRDVLKSYYPDEIRYLMISSHYRSPINYSDQELDNARAGLNRLYVSLRGLAPALAPAQEPYTARFFEAMDDDFNSREALSVMFDIAREINRLKDSGKRAAANGLGALMLKLGEVFGVLDQDPEQWLKRPPRGGQDGDGQAAMDDAAIDALIAERLAAKSAKDYARADGIREQLSAAGIVLEDGAGGTIWRRD